MDANNSVASGRAEGEASVDDELLSASQIVERWFEMRKASEEGETSPGSRRQPPAAPVDFDGITLVIRGDGDSKQKVDRLTASGDASLVLYRRSGDETTALIKWSGSVDAFAQRIDFGTVVETDLEAKKIVVEVTAEP